MLKRRINNSFGFSLIEVLVAMILLSSIGVLALNSFNNSSRMSGGKQNIAANLAKWLLEDLKPHVRDLGWGNPALPLAPGAHPAGLPATYPVFTALDGVNYRRGYTVADVDIDSDGVADLRRVTAIVDWTP